MKTYQVITNIRNEKKVIYKSEPFDAADGDKDWAEFLAAKREYNNQCMTLVGNGYVIEHGSIRCGCCGQYVGDIEIVIR